MLIKEVTKITDNLGGGNKRLTNCDTAINLLQLLVSAYQDKFSFSVIDFETMSEHPVADLTYTVFEPHHHVLISSSSIGIK